MVREVFFQCSGIYDQAVVLRVQPQPRAGPGSESTPNHAFFARCNHSTMHEFLACSLYSTIATLMQASCDTGKETCITTGTLEWQGYVR